MPFIICFMKLCGKQNPKANSIKQKLIQEIEGVLFKRI